VRRLNLFLCICLVLSVLPLGCGQETGSLVEIDGAVGVSAAVALTEARIGDPVHSMEVLARTEEVKSGQWAKMSALLGTIEATSLPLVAWFVLPDGSYYTVNAGLAGANLSDRPYFSKAMSGENTIGDLVTSKSTGRKSMVATVPVVQEGSVVGALGISVYLDELSQLIAEDLQLTDEMILYAVNDEDQIALHTNTALILEDSSVVGDMSRVVSETSALLGWTFYLGSN